MEQQKKKMGIGKKILIGFGILIVIGIIGNYLDPKKQSDKVETNATEQNFTQEQKDSIKKSEIAEIKKNTYSAQELIASYEENEVNADNNFKGKTLYVGGVIEEIKKDIVDDIYVTLKGSDGLRQVQCYFDNKEIAAKLQKGMNVVFKGKCDGLMMNVIMKDCELVPLD